MRSLHISSDGSNKRTHMHSAATITLRVSCLFLCVKPSGTNVSEPRCCRPSYHLKCVGLRGGNLRSEPSQLDTRASATPVHTPSSLNTTLHTSANPTACTEHCIPRTDRHEPGACQEHVICILMRSQALYSPGNFMTQEMNLMCVSHEDLLLSEPSIKWYISILSHTVDTQLSFFSMLPLSLHCKPKHSPLSHDDNGSIKDFFTARKPW